MSKSSVRRRQKRQQAPKPPASKPMSDRAVYIGLGVVGLFVVLLAWLWADPQNPVWGPVAVGYAAAVAYLINFYTYQVYRGKHLAPWQQSLARIPLRFVGYGTKGGKPLEAAHDHSETRNALMMSVGLSAVIVVGLGLLLIPGLI